jgi:RimJ/RimL family protein N-acetyltransferase
MRLRPVEERDLEVVRELRNRNRDWFFQDDEITPEQHAAWFASLASRRQRFYVIEQGDRVVGTISVTERNEGNEVGNLVLAEEFRGSGLMTRAVENVLREPGRYFARVKPDNEASLAVFRRAGFRGAYVELERRID